MEKEFIELLFYVKENNNLEGVLEAVKELSAIRFDYVTTDRILFICEQSAFSSVEMDDRDETMNPSVSNMKAYVDIFNQIDEGVASHE